jgi:diguanylate cyclase (GGDEF)-like protein
MSRSRNEYKRGYLAAKAESVTDALTGIANRRALEEKVAKLFEESRSGKLSDDIAVVSIDLNGFKKINDELGHAAGDLVLQHFAKTLNGCVKLQKDFIARPGGDEFVVLVKAPDANQAANLLMNRLAQELSQNLLHIDEEDKKYQVEVKFSYGVKAFSAVDLISGIIPEHFLKKSDEGLYESKKTKSNSRIVVLQPQ